MLTRKIYYKSDSTVLTVTHYYYDGKGRLINSLRRYATGQSAVFTYAWEGNNPNFSSRTGIFLNGLKMEEKYHYDE